MESLNETDFVKKVGKNLRRIRKRRGWSLEYCEQMGVVNWKHLQRIETGHKDIRISTVYKLANIYGVSVTEILGEL